MIRLDRTFIQNPHDLYRRLRAEGPAARVVIWGAVPVWLITRYTEARALLNDPRLSKDHARMQTLFPPGTGGAHAFSIDATMLQQDPPEHTRLRRLVVKAFTAGAVERMRPGIERITEELLDTLEGAAAVGPVDLVESLARPLPLRVIGDCLGVPATMRDRFRTAVEPLLSSIRPDEVATASAILTTLMRQLIAQKRHDPGPDLLSALVDARDNGDRLSEGELLATTYLLILAGYETTVNLIGNTVLALVQNPSQLALLRDQPSLLPKAVDEFLRYEGPVNIATVRFTIVPIRVGDVDIPANELVMIALSAANRDDGQFDNPDRLDITRKPHSHLAFGHGIHYCVGAPLARLEAEVALDRLLARFARITLDDTATLQYRISTLTRALKSLPVQLIPR
ncbi:cytochrome P450 family protein [Mycobacterium heidelbergense]|uniref:cytochrome P450 family protein n=1 Tax=Mycobacterium heidelbergense TaxID=53376 RepID=UPI003CEED70D